jgi:mevalonate kinase
MTTASAPGKIILFGEHAVVYGRPAIAAPVTQVHADVEVTDSHQPGIWIDAPDISLHTELGTLPDSHPLSVLIIGTFKAVGITYKLPLTIHIHSTIPVASGLGSGAAVSVAIARALSTHLGLPLTDDQVSQLAYGTEALYHGTPSGIDNTVVTYGCPVYFVKGQTIETLRVGAPFTIVIGDTGVPAPTKESVGDVRKLWERDITYWEKVFDQVGDLAKRARGAIESGNAPLLGELMNLNHELLQTMTVSSPDLDRLVHVARSTGALGAKLSGGGRGGNMIALVKPDRAEIIANALRTVGAKHTIITTVQ